MTLRLEDRWIWDFWTARAGDETHVFYLQAPRSLGDPERRHHHATVGHARTEDGRRWQVLEDALGPGPEGAWDDLAIWTGSVVSQGGTSSMLYTGVCRAEGGRIQRIGLARSTDLCHWEKHPDNPVLEADGRWYEVYGQGRWRDQSWRDPWVYPVAASGEYQVLITARSREGAVDGAGVVGRARSLDLERWEVLPPLTTPGEFAQVEVPQLHELKGRVAILFSCQEVDHSRRRRDRLGGGRPAGTYMFSAPSLEGPFTASRSPCIARDVDGVELYAGKLLSGLGEDTAFVAFRGYGPKGFVGELSDPLPAGWTEGGDLVVDG